MITYIERRHTHPAYRVLSFFIAFTFTFSSIMPPQASAQLVPQTLLNLPAPGTMVPTTDGFIPPLIKGITIHPENPLEFDFIVGRGDEEIDGKELEVEATKMIKYFLAALTIPEEELWVNLSPYEKDRIIPEGLGRTEMGQDLLTQDYLLKQLSASLMYPEDELGKKFWDKVYKKAYEKYGTTEIPMNTFNKVWIVPSTAVVYEKDASAFVVDSHLEVMLEEDYLALERNTENTKYGMNGLEKDDIDVISGLSFEVVREILIPEIEKEVNQGKTFENLRQIYNAMVLATWYKQNLRESLLGKIYVDKSKTKGVDVEDKEINQKIYNQYVEAFKKGVYNYIREDYDQSTQSTIPRKYFSGGFNRGPHMGAPSVRVIDGAAAASPIYPAGSQNEPTGRERRFNIVAAEVPEGSTAEDVLAAVVRPGAASSPIVRSFSVDVEQVFKRPFAEGQFEEWAQVGNVIHYDGRFVQITHVSSGDEVFFKLIDGDFRTTPLVYDNKVDAKSNADTQISLIKATVEFWEHDRFITLHLRQIHEKAHWTNFSVFDDVGEGDILEMAVQKESSDELLSVHSGFWKVIEKNDDGIGLMEMGKNPEFDPQWIFLSAKDMHRVVSDIKIYSASSPVGANSVEAVLAILPTSEDEAIDKEAIAKKLGLTVDVVQAAIYQLMREEKIVVSTIYSYYVNKANSSIGTLGSTEQEIVDILGFTESRAKRGQDIIRELNTDWVIVESAIGRLLAKQVIYMDVKELIHKRQAAASSPVEVVLPRVNPTQTASWAKLHELSAEWRERFDLRSMFGSDDNRSEKLSVALNDGFEVDFSKNLIDEETLATLLQLADEAFLREAIELMFTGEKINETEGRAVLHTALRNVTRIDDGELVAANGPVYVDGEDVMPDVIAVLNQMKEFTKKVRSGEWKGATGKRIKHVINVGIGGSDLGPKMAAEALKSYGRESGITAHFLSNIDGTAAAELMNSLDAEETLVIIESKSFTTQETIQNATTLKKWVSDHYETNPDVNNEDAIKKHFVAVSTAKDLVEEFGIDPANMFAFWDWVGGRYSVWSAIGLTLATYIGFDNFLEMLEGAREVDEHFRNQPFNKNIPVLKALLGVWYGNFLGAESFAILPYDQYLSIFPAFAQQFFMESNGKSTDRRGNLITNYQTGQIVWGAAGTDGQHSFYQLIHQGTRLVPADFVGIARSQNPLKGHHEKLYANFVAQPFALAFGAQLEEVKKALAAKGSYDDEDLDWHAAQQTFEGNKPTTSILIDELTPRTLGSLIAMYEHQIMAEGILLDIFSFDQWGVQLGKTVATEKVLPFLDGSQSSAELLSVERGRTIKGVVDRFNERQIPPASSPVLKVLNPLADQGLLRQELADADVIVGGVYIKDETGSAVAPILIDEELLGEISKSIPKVIIDVSIDQGGNIARASRGLDEAPFTSHDFPARLDKFGNLRIMVPNMPAAFGEIASPWLSEVTQPILTTLASGISPEEMLELHPEIISGMRVLNRRLADRAVAKAHGRADANDPVKYTNASDIEVHQALEVLHREQTQITVGIPAEIKSGERRIAKTPQEVRELTEAGVRVLVETGAGEKSGFSDDAYHQAGAKIVKGGDVEGELAAEFIWEASDIIVKVKEPQDQELGYLDRYGDGKVLFTYFHLANEENQELTRRLVENNVTAIAYESVIINGQTPLLEPMSRVAGWIAALWATLYREEHNNFSSMVDGNGKIRAEVVASVNERLRGLYGAIRDNLDALKGSDFTFPTGTQKTALVMNDGPGNVVALGGGHVGRETLYMAHLLGARELVITEVNEERRDQLADDVFALPASSPVTRIVPESLREIKKAALGVFRDLIGGVNFDEGIHDVNIVIGNEAADLDSIVSTIVYAITKRFQFTEGQFHIPVINMLREDFRLKRPAVRWLAMNGIHEDDLIFIDDFDVVRLLSEYPLERLRKMDFHLRVTLMDHNVVAQHQQVLAQAVTRVFDHHPNDAESREVGYDRLPEENVVIEPVGSNATLVASDIFESDQTSIFTFDQSADIARLLAGPIILDTVNFSQGRFTDKDVSVLAALEGSYNLGLDHDDIFETLSSANFDLGDLTIDELLRSDFKTYIMGTKRVVISSITGASMQKLRVRGNIIQSVGAFGRKFEERGQEIPDVLIGLNIDRDEAGDAHRDMFIYSEDKELLKRFAAFLEGIETLKDAKGHDVNVDLQATTTTEERLIAFRTSPKISRKLLIGSGQEMVLAKFFETDVTTTEDRASSPIIKIPGGINLNPELLDLQIKRDGNGVPLPMEMQPIGEMHIDGFVPIIINVTPVNLPMLLGLVEKPFDPAQGKDSPFDSADSDAQDIPMDLGYVEKYRNKFVREYDDV